jgi:S-adenosylmethionine decarboxylase proenzyme
MSVDIPNMGCHLILDFHGTTVDMNNFEELDKNFRRIIIDSGATIENMLKKQFEPQGLSILYLLSESHFSIHTWPEFGACAIDFYHCGETARQRMIKAEELLCEYLGWENCTGSMIIDRGSYNYALITQNETSSILFKKHKLVNRFKTESGDTRLYSNEENGKLLAVDGVIQMGFHNISNLGTLFLEDNDCEKQNSNCKLTKSFKYNEQQDNYFLDQLRSSVSGKTKDSSKNNNSSVKNSPREVEEELFNVGDKVTNSPKQEKPEVKESKKVLIIGTGDLSLPHQMILNGYADHIVVLDEDVHHDKRLKAILENNKNLGTYIDNKCVEFISHENELTSNDKFSGMIVINKKYKPNNLKNFLEIGAYYSEVVMKEAEFLEICKYENFHKLSFHEISNTITRFLIGKARFS